MASDGNALLVSETTADDADWRDVLDVVFANVTEGVLVTDAKRRIVAVNDAFTRITGYSAAEVIGKDPRFLDSGRHDPAFIDAMKRRLAETGRWEGEVWNRRRNGEAFPNWISIVAVPRTGKLRYHVTVFSDITQRKHDEERSNYQANYDALTGLPNRRLIHDRVHRALVRAGHAGHSMALIYIDIDDFKAINERVGHGLGDVILIEIGQRIAASLRRPDAVGRLGSDEFIAIVPEVSEPEEVVPVVKRLIEAVRRPLIAKGHVREVEVGVSIGIVVYPADGATAIDLIRNAAIAAAYATERDERYVFFSPTMNRVARRGVDDEERLARAFANREFELHYQPKVDLRHGRIIGAEALIRWRDPDKPQLVGPDKFIGLAERTGLIEPIGAWVIDAACRQIQEWRRTGLPDMIVAVNVSAHQLSSERFLGDVKRIIDSHGIDPGRLEIEITESSLMERADDAILVLGELRAMGIRLTADDFGTGYSSLNYLRRFPLDAIKIDRSFVSDIGGEAGPTLAAAVIAVGQSLNKKVIAEGVETEAQLSFLRQQWCDEIQGYYFSEPVPADAFAALVRNGKRL